MATTFIFLWFAYQSIWQTPMLNEMFDNPDFRPRDCARTSGFSRIRISLISRNLDISMSGVSKIRISGFPYVRVSGSSDFKISEECDVDVLEASGARHRRCQEPSEFRCAFVAGIAELSSEGPDSDGLHSEGPASEGLHSEGPDSEGNHSEGPDSQGLPSEAASFRTASFRTARFRRAPFRRPPEGPHSESLRSLR